MQESLLQMLISMTKRRKIYVKDLDGKVHHGIIGMIQAEDGSGTKFNVTIDDQTIFIPRPVGSGLTAQDPIKAMNT